MANERDISRCLFTYFSSCVRDARVQTHLEEGYTKAILDVQVDFTGVTDPSFISNSYSFRFTLLDANRHIVCDRYHGVKQLEPVLQMVDEVSAPLLWTAESPYLYTLLLTMYDSDHHILEVKRTMLLRLSVRISPCIAVKVLAS